MRIILTHDPEVAKALSDSDASVLVAMARPDENPVNAAARAYLELASGVKLTDIRFYRVVEMKVNEHGEYKNES